MRRWYSRILLAILAALLLGNHAWAAANMQLTIVNNSGYPDHQVYLVWMGQPGSDPGNWYHITDWQNIAIQINATADNTVHFPDNPPYYYADYSTTLDKLNKNAAGRYYFEMPPCPGTDSIPKGVATGRLWISFGKPVYVNIVSAAAYTQPDPTNATDVNNNTVWDFFEPKSSYNATTDQFSAHADTTCVDYVTMPMVYELYNGATQLGIAGLNITRKELYAALGAVPLLKPLMTPLRMLAPGHGQSAHPTQPLYFPGDYFDSYRDYCWTYWTNNTFSFQYDTNTDGSLITWSGQVVNDVLTLTGKVNGRPETHTINKPASQDIFLCNGVFNQVTSSVPGYTGRDADLKNQIASALNRSVMHKPPYPNPAQPTQYPWGAYTADYYLNNDDLPADVFKTNIYSHVLHQQAIDGKIYGFAYDDNNNQSSYIEGVGTEIRLTINNCLLGAAGMSPGALQLLLYD